jgi:hypothetical protein
MCCALPPRRRDPSSASVCCIQIHASSSGPRGVLRAFRAFRALRATRNPFGELFQIMRYRSSAIFDGHRHNDSHATARHDNPGLEGKEARASKPQLAALRKEPELEGLFKLILRVHKNPSGKIQSCVARLFPRTSNCIKYLLLTHIYITVHLSSSQFLSFEKITS